MPLLVLGGVLTGCQVPRVAAAGFGFRGSWPVPVMAFLSYWTEGLALVLAFAVVGLVFRSRPGWRGTNCPPGYALAALAGCALCVPPGTVVLLAAGPLVVFGVGLVIAGWRQPSAVLAWCGVFAGAAGVVCGLARAFGVLAGWQYETFVLVLGLASVAGGLVARDRERRVAGQLGSVLPGRMFPGGGVPTDGHRREARPGRRWRLAAGVVAALVVVAVLEVWVRPLLPDQPQIRALRPAIISYLQSGAYRSENGSPGAYASGKLIWLCNVSVLELRAQGPRWLVGMNAECADYATRDCAMRDGGDMGEVVLTLSGVPGRYRVVSASQEPGDAWAYPGRAPWVDRHFSALTAFWLNLGLNIIDRGTDLPKARRCGNPTAGRTLARPRQLPPCPIRAWLHQMMDANSAEIISMPPGIIFIETSANGALA